MVSPSELPDSPTQMVPPSPKATNTVDFSMRRPSDNEKSLQLSHRLLPKSTVFEDKLTKFKEESTPLHFSAATSLSSLTIDDHDEVSQQHEHVEETLTEEPGQVEIDKQDEMENVRHEVSNEFEDDLLEQDDENDEEILAACIKMGMPSKRLYLFSLTLENLLLISILFFEILDLINRKKLHHNATLEVVQRHLKLNPQDFYLIPAAIFQKMITKYWQSVFKQECQNLEVLSVQYQLHRLVTVTIIVVL